MWQRLGLDKAGHCSPVSALERIVQKAGSYPAMTEVAVVHNLVCPVQLDVLLHFVRREIK